MKKILNNKYIMYIIKYIFLFAFGGFSYIIIELLYRGHTHISMFILGGICFVLVGLVNNIIPWNMCLELQILIGTILVTSLEFIAGYILNIKMGLNIWDYSNLPLNFMGQICLEFSHIWSILCFVSIVIDDLIRYCVFNEDKPTYHLAIVQWIKRRVDNYANKKRNS